eukprot:10397-Heterococcus_DN1.PRE.4
MDSLFGVSGQGLQRCSLSFNGTTLQQLLRFVVLAADAQVARSILLYQSDKDKIKALDSHKLLAAAGPQADCNIFGEYIQKNLALYELNNELRLTTAAAANFVRRELATALRSGPYQSVNYTVACNAVTGKYSCAVLVASANCTVGYSAAACTYPCSLRTRDCASSRTCTQCPIMQAPMLQQCST